MKKTAKNTVSLVLAAVILTASLGIFAPSAGARGVQTSDALIKPAAAAEQSDLAQSGTAPNLKKVQNLKIASYASDKITVEWSALSGAMGYNVYYKSLDTAGAKLALLTSTKSTRVTLNNLTAGSKWEFQICGYTVVDGEVLEGETAVYQTASKPDSVSSVWLTASSKNISIRWNAASHGDGYLLYREDKTTGGKWVEYKRFSLGTTSFTDTNTTPGKFYNYLVQTYSQTKDEGGRKIS